MDEMEIMMAQKWMRVSSLAQAAQAAKDTPAGHRVYLRCMSMLEIELGVVNPKNSEVAEGFLNSISELVDPKDDEQLPTEEDEEV